MKIQVEINNARLAKIAKELDVDVEQLKEDLVARVQDMFDGDMLYETCAEAVDY